MRRRRLEPVSSLRGSVSGFEFGGTSLRALDVADAALLGGRVRAVRAEQAAMTRVDVRSVEFTGCELGSLRWTGGKVSRARFDDCKLLGARFEGVRLEHVVFTGCKLDYALFDKLRATGPVLFAGCSLREAEFNGAACRARCSTTATWPWPRSGRAATAGATCAAMTCRRSWGHTISSGSSSTGRRSAARLSARRRTGRLLR